MTPSPKTLALVTGVLTQSPSVGVNSKVPVKWVPSNCPAASPPFSGGDGCRR